MESELCVTALYDCRSKQEYIYRTNRIREISGGSMLLANVYGDFFKKVAEKGIKIKSDWQNEDKFVVESFIESGNDGEVIYEGGGNLFMIYRSREIYIKANRIFSRMLIDTTYSVSLIASCVETTGDFMNDRKKLYEENNRVKSTGGVSVPCCVLPITQVDGLTYMPITSKKDGVSISQESVLKRRAFDKIGVKGEIYLDDISGIKNKGTESLIAIIYVDGNAMGEKVKNCTQGKSGYSDCTEALRELSKSTNRSFVERPIAAIDKMMNEKKGDGFHNYRQVIAGGDEITIICSARAALDVAETYFKTLEEENVGLPEDKRNYACMGIAIAHSHAPFSDIYKVAEQCCESGKKKSRAKKSRVNYIDFHFCRSGITNDLDSIRESQEKEYTLRPYEVSEEFADFVDMGKSLGKIGRANIKNLATAIIDGDSFYKFEAMRIKSRTKSVLDIDNEEQKKMLFDIAGVYDLWFNKVTETEELE